MYSYWAWFTQDKLTWPMLIVRQNCLGCPYWWFDKTALDSSTTVGISKFKVPTAALNKNICIRLCIIFVLTLRTSETQKTDCFSLLLLFCTQEYRTLKSKQCCGLHQQKASIILHQLRRHTHSYPGTYELMLIVLELLALVSEPVLMCIVCWVLMILILWINSGNFDKFLGYFFHKIQFTFLANLMQLSEIDA